MGAEQNHSAYLEEFLRKQKNYEQLLEYTKSSMSQKLCEKELPEDLLQNAIIGAFRRIGKFESGKDIEGSLMAWLRQLIHRSVIDSARKHLGTRRESEIGIERLEYELLAQAPDDDESPTRKVSKKESIAFLKDAIRQLSGEKQTALQLYYDKSLSIDEVAKIIGKTRSATIQFLHRIRMELRELMGKSSLYHLGPKKK